MYPHCSAACFISLSITGATSNYSQGYAKSCPTTLCAIIETGSLKASKTFSSGKCLLSILLKTSVRNFYYWPRYFLHLEELSGSKELLVEVNPHLNKPQENGQGAPIASFAFVL